MLQHSGGPRPEPHLQGRAGHRSGHLGEILPKSRLLGGAADQSEYLNRYLCCVADKLKKKGSVCELFENAPLREKSLLQQSSFVMFVLKVSTKDRILQNYSWDYADGKSKRVKNTTQLHKFALAKYELTEWPLLLGCSPTPVNYTTSLSLTTLSCHYVDSNTNDLFFPRYTPSMDLKQSHQGIIGLQTFSFDLRGFTKRIWLLLLSYSRSLQSCDIRRQF